MCTFRRRSMRLTLSDRHEVKQLTLDGTEGRACSKVLLAFPNAMTGRQNRLGHTKTPAGWRGGGWAGFGVWFSDRKQPKSRAATCERKEERRRLRQWQCLRPLSARWRQRTSPDVYSADPSAMITNGFADFWSDTRSTSSSSSGRVVSSEPTHGLSEASVFARW